MQKRNLGGLVTSAIGLGCMGLSQGYGPADDANSVRAIHRALDLGVTMLDTAMSYGQGHNERLIARALHGRAEPVLVATKFGIVRDPGGVRVDGRPEHVRGFCEASLRRLGWAPAWCPTARSAADCSPPPSPGRTSTPATSAAMTRVSTVRPWTATSVTSGCFATWPPGSGSRRASSRWRGCSPRGPTSSHPRQPPPGPDCGERRGGRGGFSPADLERLARALPRSAWAGDRHSFAVPVTARGDGG